MKTVDKGLELENQKCQHIGLKSRHMSLKSGQMLEPRIEVSTHGFEESTHKDSGQRF